MNNLPALRCRARRMKFAAPAAGACVGITDDELPPTERVRLLLQQLDYADYLPPSTWHDALEILAGPAAEDVLASMALAAPAANVANSRTGCG